jgi:medium-chain acyl-[acyl-carrier-protein] hydrolase
MPPLHERAFASCVRASGCPREVRVKPNLWLARVDFRPAVALRLVCFSHAGSGAAPFMRWTRSVPERVALCPLRRPGQEIAWREPPLRDVASIADGSLAALSTLPPRPTVLLGHSLGAAVAFEVARRMEAAGQPPELLIVSAKPPVHLPSRRPLLAHLQPDERFLDAVDTTYGGIPDEVRREPELLAMVLPVLRADLAASESYRADPRPRLGCPIRVCYGVDDRAIDADLMPAWGELTRGTLEIEPFPGGHFYLFESTNFIDALLRALSRRPELGVGA